MNIKLPYKLLLINAVIALVLSVLFGISTGSLTAKDFPAMFGLISMLYAIVCLFAGLVLLFVDDKRWAQGFLLSGGVLLLLGFFTCSTFYKYHP
jgi:hypothetical protein